MKMLSASSWDHWVCCGHHDRKRGVHRTDRERDRHTARAREKRTWQRDPESA